MQKINKNNLVDFIIMIKYNFFEFIKHFPSAKKYITCYGIKRYLHNEFYDSFLQSHVRTDTVI